VLTKELAAHPSPLHRNFIRRLGNASFSFGIEAPNQAGSPWNLSSESEIPEKAMSALAPKADICSAPAHVCFGPIADIEVARIFAFM
jgi:hypothetical protein